ncbi:ubiquitin carboxyl-terminal hydrolase 8 isoform X2 [Jatropha curcas]|uniref:ubiquitin carboxyl-terminal hydrolase 8 isoform X2 n=1 Tax=Jatropha curcas TaxID=180498 RepID=UPI0005FC0E70|nr:ubiquitin carboxyl-terminal hydrolase 8 isoform X2 [Jatropha curcas]
MSRLSENLRLSVITKSTRSLSLKLANFSLSTIRVCKSIARVFFFKTLALFPSIMDDEFFPSTSEDKFLDLELDHRSTNSTANNRHLRLFVDDDDNDVEKLYLVPYRWWRQTQIGANETGVLYDVSAREVGGVGLLLDLRKVDDYRKSDNSKEIFSWHEYALLSGTMWLQALKWHSDSKVAAKEVHNPLLAGGVGNSEDVFPIQIRLSVSWETNSLIVKISLKLQIWDISGQTTQFFVNDRINLPNGSMGQSEEIPLELLIHGFPNSMKGRNIKIDELTEYDERDSSFSIGSVKMNGSSDHISSCSTPASASFSGYGYGKVGLLGLTGLQNLGNTCFMNSAIQCLAHTPKLVDYFLGDYKKEINRENPLGLNGELALAFGDLLRKLWAPGSNPVAPRMFKLKLSNFAPQFSGYNQHDSQEFLAFLLDGLHEDLNRVKCKPYIEVKDAEDRPDKEVADEYWKNHLARNDSIIVDLFQGQYRSTLVCPNCKKKSVTFDPFMYLSLPLPSTSMRTMTLTVVSTDGFTLPYPITVSVPKCGRLKDLIEALSTACSLRNDERLLVAEIYRNKVFRFLEEPSDSLALIRDDDKLVAYRLPRNNDTSPLVVFLHEVMDKPSELEKAVPSRKLFGIPLVARLSNISNGFDLCKLFLKLLNPFLMSSDDELNDHDLGAAADEASAMEEVPSPTVSGSNAVSDGETDDDPDFSTDFQFCIRDYCGATEIKMNKPLLVSKLSNKLEVHAFWSEKMMEKYDTCILSSLPEVFKPQLYTRRPQESVSLYKCLEAFLKEEPLGPEDMWYCPSCKKPRQASKKLDLWRLPEILVVHLKRFSYSRIIKNKLETYVDFPVEHFDLSTYISHEDGRLSNCYQLYAISNHYGGMGGGHYTAFINHGHGRWYEYDDDNVSPVSEDRIKTSAAYVLFYRRFT